MITDIIHTHLKILWVQLIDTKCGICYVFTVINYNVYYINMYNI